MSRHSESRELTGYRIPYELLGRIGAMKFGLFFLKHAQIVLEGGINERNERNAVTDNG